MVPSLISTLIFSFVISSPEADLQAQEQAFLIPAMPEPGSKEILGTHTGSKEKLTAPYQMVLVPAGRVMMGMTEEDALTLSEGDLGRLGRLAHSIPKHQVRVDEFYCDIYEVTNAQWKAYLDATGNEPSEDLVKYAWGGNTTYPEKEANFPIRNVTLTEARDFARWCGKRIPSESEWVRAAAGDDGRIYCFGKK